MASFLLLALLGNAACFYFFDGQLKPGITVWDALWYSIVSITTIGYGDLYATSLGARLGCLVFIIGIGLTTFTAVLGLLVDQMMQLNYKETHGLSTMHCRNHVMIVNYPDTTRIEQIIEELQLDAEYSQCDVVVVTDSIETLPFDKPNVYFIKGSPLQADTLQRAGVERARMALVLADSSNSASDGLVAATINLIEHLNPEVKTVAECLDYRHDILFRSSHCDSIIYINRILNSMLVQEVQDPGVAAVLSTLTGNSSKDGFYSCPALTAPTIRYQDLAKSLLDSGRQLVAVVRDGIQHLDYRELSSLHNDTVVYLGQERLTWDQLINSAKA